MKKRILLFSLILVMVCGIISGINPSQVSEPTLSSTEKRQFSKYISERMEVTEYGTNFSSDEFGMIYGAKFSLCDVNQDGCKDLVITGALGLRTMTLSEVYMHVGDKYVTVPYGGTITGVGKKGICIDTDDYEQAGAIRYTDESIYKIDSKGNSKSKLQFFKSVMFYDIENNIEYKKGKLLSKNYYINGKKTTKAKYNTIRKKYKFKSIKWHNMTKTNINKYL